MVRALSRSSLFKFSAIVLFSVHLGAFASDDGDEAKDVWQSYAESARLYALKFKESFTRDEFSSTREFIDYFSLPRVYKIPKRMGSLHEGLPEEAEVHAIAEIYFAELRKQLPKFLRLHPTAAEARWVLEAPLQFPLALHDDRPYSIAWAPFWKRPFMRHLPASRAGEYRTATDIFAVLNTVVSAMADVQNIEDWLQLVTFQVPPASEYESFQRWVLNRFLDRAVLVGDGSLTWMSSPIFENRQALGFIGVENTLSWFMQLYELRNSIPQADRSDSTLTAKALQLLLGGVFQQRVKEIMVADANHPIKRALVAALRDGEVPDGSLGISPRDLAKSIGQAQAGLLRYLAMRSQAGALLRLNSGDIFRIAEIANASRFELSNISPRGDGTSTFLVVKKKKPLQCFLLWVSRPEN